MDQGALACLGLGDTTTSLMYKEGPLRAFSPYPFTPNSLPGMQGQLLGGATSVVAPGTK